MEKLEACSNQFFTNIIDTHQRMATNLNDRLPVTYNQGEGYLLVLYEYDRNIILVHPMKARMDK